MMKTLLDRQTDENNEYILASKNPRRAIVYQDFLWSYMILQDLTRFYSSTWFDNVNCTTRRHALDISNKLELLRLASTYTEKLAEEDKIEFVHHLTISRKIRSYYAEDVEAKSLNEITNVKLSANDKNITEAVLNGAKYKTFIKTNVKGVRYSTVEDP
ncbi:unnamed protein product [Didymodactylos carnosus]|uniref:Uncharacterized protein n=1 Tax=Didymodactylos carnosus TaxID=1234261 RepID=A0A816AFC2_9BILA|nr:unnamed protein product [Didymodactylos carnosus]CAF4469028.1 unnamed protein product [Didymodactylos carnosus]